MNRQLFASCNKTVIRTSHNHINNQNSNNNMLSMNMPGGYTSSLMPSSGQARWDERLEEESQRTYSPWSGKLVFAKTRKEENNNGLADERNECPRRGSTSSNDQSGFSEQDEEVQHIKTITRNIHDVDTYDGIHKSDPGTGSSLSIDRIIDLTLSPSPSGSKSRIPDQDEQMITPIRARPRAVARYASPECRTAMSPLKPRFSGPAQQQPKVGLKTLHPFFNPPTAACGSPSSPLPPLSHAPRLSMRTLQPGSQSTESATSSSQASTSTYASTSTGTSSTTTSPGSYRRPVQVLRGLQNSRVVIEERITTGHRELWTWGKSREVEKVPDDLILDFDALNLDVGALPKSATATIPSKATTNVRPSKTTTLVKPKIAPAPKPAEPEIAPEPVIPRRPVNKAFFDVQDLPFFSYKSLKPPPTIVYTCCPDETDDLLPLLKGDVVGFDMEWPVNYRRYKGSTKATKLDDKTALIQICDDKIVLLLHLSKMRSFPKGLMNLINNEKIFKVGVNIRGDARKIHQDYEYVDPKSMLDLSFLARAVDPDNCGNGSQLISLARLTRGYIGNDLNKDDGLRKSDWSLALDEDQKEYAANDVVASMSIYRKLEHLAKERGLRVDRDEICNPPPPTPPAANSVAAYWARRKSWGKK